MKELLAKGIKFVGASVGVLLAAYTVGWSGATTLHFLFKSDRAEAEKFVIDHVTQVENRVMGVHNADMNGIHGSLNILIDQNKMIISQNYRTRKAIEDN